MSRKLSTRLLLAPALVLLFAGCPDPLTSGSGAGGSGNGAGGSGASGAGASGTGASGAGGSESGLCILDDSKIDNCILQ